MSETWIDELCEQIAINVGRHSTSNSVKCVLKGLYKIILYQLKINGKITIPKFGTFEIIKSEEKEMKIGNAQGEMRYIYVEPRNKIVFRPSKALNRNINENKFEMKEKKKKTVKKDYEKEKIKPIKYTVAQMFQTAQERGKNGKTNL